MKTIRHLIMGIALVVAVTASAVPPRLHYQGRLLDPVGNPISANVTMAIDLYAAATGGSPLYSESVGAVAVINGIYSFEFGQNPEALAAALETDEVWLEVRVNGEALTPRQRLNASPYAIRSGRVDVERDPLWSGVSNAVSDQAVLGAAAHGWGDHGTEGYLTVETDPLWSAVSNAVTESAGLGATAHGWGDHGAEGYLTTESDPLWSAVSNAVSDQAALGAAAHGWGDHGTEGYLTVEADPLWSAVSNAVTESAGLGETAHGWGDHGAEGYLTTESDPLWSAVSNAVSDQAALGAAAYGWGDHGAAGYVPVSGATMTGALALPAGGLSVGASQFVVLANGNVGIGLANPTNTLAVNGDIRAREIVVTLDGWPDYVFAPDYRLRPLDEVQAFIARHGHLPDIPSANEIAQGGVNLGASQAQLLRKIEELTLYMLQLKQENAELKNDLNALGRSVEALQAPR